MNRVYADYSRIAFSPQLGMLPRQVWDVLVQKKCKDTHQNGMLFMHGMCCTQLKEGLEQCDTIPAACMLQKGELDMRSLDMVLAASMADEGQALKSKSASLNPPTSGYLALQALQSYRTAKADQTIAKSPIVPKSPFEVAKAFPHCLGEVSHGMYDDLRCRSG